MIHYRELVKKMYLLLLSLLLIQSPELSASDKKPNIFVTVKPQAGIIKSIAGNLVDTTVLITGSCPDTFSPTAKQIKNLSDADIYFTLALPFEKIWIKKTSLTKDKIKPMGKGIKLKNVESLKEHHHDGIDKDYKHHIHGSKDPHIWVSLKNSLKMADNTYEILVELMPEHKKEFKKNLEEYKKKISSLDLELKKRFTAQKDKNIFVFHPVFAYLAYDYGLKQIVIQVEGKDPTAKQLTKIIDMIKDKKAKVIFTQPEFSDRTARAVAKQTNTKIIPISIYNEDISLTVKDLIDKWETNE